MPKRIPKYVNDHPFVGEVVIFIIVIITVGLLYINQSNISNDIIESQFVACQRGNDLREVLIDNIKSQKVQTRNTDPALFPQIPPNQFRLLIDEALARYDEQIESLSPVNCLEAFPAAKELDNIGELSNTN
jgi:hypothetical protein